MIPAVRCDVDQVGSRLLVRVTGDLSLSSAPRLRTRLIKCLMEHPHAVVVDLAGLTTSEPQALSVFSTVARQAALWPGTPLLLCAAAPAMAALLASGRYGRLETFGTAAQALAAEPRRSMAFLSEIFLPASGAARQARDLVTEACVRWELPHLVGPGCVVAGELVTNAVVHAQTMVDLRISRGRRYLIIAVRDGSTEPPVLTRTPLPDATGGRGLVLVEAMAWRWGTLLMDDGKVVWATLPLHGQAMP
jgi:anti-anti-sigma regulatory factor